MIDRWEIAAWVVIGQGVGSKADGTYLYLTWSIPQP